MKKKHFILISESDVGVHSKDENGEQLPFTIIALSFYPNVKKENSEILFVPPDKNDKFIHLIQLYHRLQAEYDVKVMLGYDLDLMGELMSCSLKEALLLKGVNEKDIYRTPLTEKGYIAFSAFSDCSKHKRYLYLQDQFLIKQKKQNSHKVVGFQKAIALDVLHKYKGRKSLVDTEISSASGTSIITVVSKFIGSEGEFHYDK